MILSQLEDGQHEKAVNSEASGLVIVLCGEAPPQKLCDLLLAASASLFSRCGETLSAFAAVLHPWQRREIQIRVAALPLWNLCLQTDALSALMRAGPHADDAHEPPAEARATLGAAQVSSGHRWPHAHRLRQRQARVCTIKPPMAEGSAPPWSRSLTLLETLRKSMASDSAQTQRHFTGHNRCGRCDGRQDEWTHCGASRGAIYREFSHRIFDAADGHDTCLHCGENAGDHCYAHPRHE